MSTTGPRVHIGSPPTGDGLYPAFRLRAITPRPPNPESISHAEAGSGTGAMVTSVGSRFNSTSGVWPVLSNRKSAPEDSSAPITVYDRGVESELMGKLPLELKSEKPKLLLLAATDSTVS